MNWLRATALPTGLALAAVAAWAVTRYGVTDAFAAAAATGVLLAAAPWLAARAKRRLERWRRRRRSDDPVAYVASTPGGREATRDRAAALLAAHPDLDARPEAFPEGEGFAVQHTGIHGTYVRVTDDHVVVTGDRTPVSVVTDAVTPAVAGDFTGTHANPLRRPAPVRGAPRVALWVVVLVGLVVGATTLTAGAYSPATYNPAERAVLVGLDAHAALAPDVTRAEAHLRKAAYLSTALREEAVEIRWLGNDTARIRDQARDAAAIRADARDALAAAAAAGAPSSRVSAVETRLSDAAAAVDAALAAAPRTEAQHAAKPATAGRPAPANATIHSI